MSWLLFDLNGTLLDPGDRSEALQQAVMLAMAETLCGGYRPFSDFIPDPPEPKLFPDVERGLTALADRHRLAVLTNSATEEAAHKLEATGIRELFEFVAGSDAVRAFKPDPRVYALGVERTGAGPGDIQMVAAHAWDLMGAARSGMRTAYLTRTSPWPQMLDEPGWQGPDLAALAQSSS